MRNVAVWRCSKSNTSLCITDAASLLNELSVEVHLDGLISEDADDPLLSVVSREGSELVEAVWVDWLIGFEHPVGREQGRAKQGKAKQSTDRRVLWSDACDIQLDRIAFYSALAPAFSYQSFKM